MDDKATPGAVVALITRVQNGDKLDLGGLIDGLVALLMAGARCPGFWSGEILPPGRSYNSDWTLVQRFRSADQLKSWQQSEGRQTLLTQIKSIAGGDQALTLDEISEDGSIGSAVTAIVTQVKPEMEEEYWAWEYKIQLAQGKFPGYGGVYLQPPAPGKAGQWSTLLRFDNAKALENWFNDPQRKELLTEANKFVHSKQYHKVASSFPGWFPSDEKSGQPTPRWKTAIMVLVGLFPILELIRIFVAPLTANFTPILAMATGTALSVSFVTFAAMPVLVNLFDWWLAPDPAKATAKTEILGLLMALAIFAIEIAVGWHIA